MQHLRFSWKRQWIYRTYSGFNWNCRDIHEYFVLTCRCHLFIGVVTKDDKWPRKVLGTCMICNFCVQVKHTINCCANKICMKKIPENIQKKLVPLNVFLKNELWPCESFFIFSNNKVSIRIDSPLDKCMVGKKKLMGYCKHLLM